MLRGNQPGDAQFTVLDHHSLVATTALLCIHTPQPLQIFLDDYDALHDIRHWIMLDTPDTESAPAAERRRKSQYELNFPPLLAVVTSSSSIERSSILTKPFPPNVHLLTFEQWTPPAPVPDPPLLEGQTTQYLLRLAHLFQALGDVPAANVPVDIHLAEYFARPVTRVQERTLNSGMPVDQVERWKWRAETPLASGGKSTDPDGAITLRPSEIRTFVVTVG
jgi:hypothetical protein